MINAVLENMISAIHEPAMIVTGEGKILAMNRLAGRTLQVDIRENNSTETRRINIENTSVATSWLKVCASCRDGIPGVLEFKNALGVRSSFQVEGSLIQQDADLKKTLILVTFMASTEKHSRFVALNRKIDDLNNRLRKTRKIQKNLEKRATIDALTGLLNRLEFFEQVTERLSRPSDQEDYGAIMMMDIDFFKRINDTFGHQTGDEVLQVTARRIQTNIRLSDIAGRYGGEEFVLFCTAHSPDDLLQTGDRLRKAIDGNPMKSKEHLIHVTASIGIETFSIEETDPEELLELIDRADKALYAAKRSGRNRACYDSGDKTLIEGTVQYIEDGAS